MIDAVVFSGRWINQGNLTAGQWLRVIKLFELELSVRKIAQQLRLSYNAANKAFHQFVLPSWLIPPMATCPLGAKSKWTNRILEGGEKGIGEEVTPAKSLFSAFWGGSDESSWKCNYKNSRFQINFLHNVRGESNYYISGFHPWPKKGSKWLTHIRRQFW